MITNNEIKFHEQIYSAHHKTRKKLGFFHPKKLLFLGFCVLINLIAVRHYGSAKNVHFG